MGKVLNADLKIAFALIVFILAIWRVKKGFDNGMLKEIVNILSAIVSCICIILIFFTVSSIRAKTFSVLTLCVLALICIGIAFKLCNLIFKPVTAIVNISIIASLDKLLGAILGLGETLIFAFFIYYLLNYSGFFIL